MDDESNDDNGNIYINDVIKERKLFNTCCIHSFFAILIYVQYNK